MKPKKQYRIRLLRADKYWTVLDRDSVSIPMSFELRKDAIDVARFLNAAYALGYRDAAIEAKERANR